MADYTFTIGTAARDYATLSAAYADVVSGAITGSSDLVAGADRVFFDVWADSDILDNIICEGVTQDATYKVVFRRATGSARPKIISLSTSLNVIRIKDSFVSFENIDIESVGDWTTSAVRIGDFGWLPIGNLFSGCRLFANAMDTNPLVGGLSCGSSTYPITFQNCLIQRYDMAANVIDFTNALAGLPQAWYLDFINCTVTGAEHGFFYRQDDPGDTYRVRLINVIVFGYFGTNAWSTGTTNGTLDTSGSSNNYSKDAGDVLPGWGAPNPVTATSNPAPGAGDWAIFNNITAWADMRPQDVVDNDLINAGVGPSANALVPTFDFDGNPRSGATTTPGAFEIPSAADVPLAVDAVTRGVREDVGATLTGQSDLSLAVAATSRVDVRALTVVLANQAASSLVATSSTRTGARGLTATLTSQLPGTLLATAATRGARSADAATLTTQAALSLLATSVTQGARSLGSATLTPQSLTFAATAVTRGVRESVGASLAAQAALPLALSAVTREPRTTFSVDITIDVLPFVGSAPTRASFGERLSATMSLGSAQDLVGLEATNRSYRFASEEAAELSMSLGTPLSWSIDETSRGVRRIGDATFMVSRPPLYPDYVPPTIVQVGGIPGLQATTRRGPRGSIAR